MAEARRAIVRGLALIFALALFAAPAWSQVRSGPSWSELSPADQQLLAPFRPEWDKWDLLRKNKWLQMAKRYPTLPAPEQERIRERMAGWAKLSTQEREAARENFKGMKKLPPDQRKDLSSKWMEYQSLPPEERKALGRTGPPRGTGAPASTIPAVNVQPSAPGSQASMPASAPTPGSAAPATTALPSPEAAAPLSTPLPTQLPAPSPAPAQSPTPVPAPPPSR